MRNPPDKNLHKERYSSLHYTPPVLNVHYFSQGHADALDSKPTRA